MQSFQNYIDRLSLVKAELKCDQEPSTLDVTNALIKRCQSTNLMVTVTPKGSKGAWRTSELDDSGTPSGISRSRLNEIQEACVWVVNNLQVKETGRTPYRSIRDKDHTGEIVPFGEVCFGRNQSEDGAKLNMRWMRGVLVGKPDRTDEILLLTATGPMRRLEGDSAWNLQFLNLCVGSPWSATAPTKG